MDELSLTAAVPRRSEPPSEAAAGDEPLDAGVLDPVVREAVCGDPGAVRRLTALLTPVIVRYCRARLGRRDFGHISAEDVAQDICVAVLRALPGYRDRGGSFLFLVRAIAANKVADVFRLAARERTHATPCVPEQPGPDNEPERHVLNTDLGHRLADLLDRLPAVQREILVLRVVVGLSATETADALGLSPANVRTTQHRALTRMRQWAAAAGGL